MKRFVPLVVLVTVTLLAGCWRMQSPPAGSIPGSAKRIRFEVVARGNRCEPGILAVDREGGAVVLDFQVTSVGKAHMFLIPDLGVRQSVPAGTRLDFPVLVERSGIHEFACTSLSWIGPFANTGKLAIK
ncbi:MAG: hypothetical protein EHM24_30735 [Acidobacteria bacterium]|nr:MAG: hypothetical protein EHM24_30735 [Acidobacteriota bacterium]